MSKNGRPQTWDEVNATMERYALAAARLAEEQGNLELELTVARDKYNTSLKLYQSQMETLEAELKAFALSHKAEFKPRDKGGDVRSYEHANISIGFRRSPPSVRIEGGEEKAAEWLREAYGQDYVSIEITPDRKALKKVLEDGDVRTRNAMAGHGISLPAGKDKFFCEAGK